MANKKNLTKLIERAIEIQAILEDVKSLYRELDDITLALIENDIFHASHKGYEISVVDNFAIKNTVFRIARVKRYDLKVDMKYVPIAKLEREIKKKVKESLEPQKKAKKATKKKKWDFPVKAK